MRDRPDEDDDAADPTDATADAPVGEAADVMAEEAADETGGTYTLLVGLSAPATLAVGALGEIAFDAGWYAYTGSALGPGGFARVDRHRELAAGERDTRHWHVDYLLGHPESRVDAAVRTAGADVECAVARSVDGDPVSGFGASDCGCGSHLVYDARRAALLGSVERAHDAARN